MFGRELPTGLPQALKTSSHLHLFHAIWRWNLGGGGGVYGFVFLRWYAVWHESGVIQRFEGTYNSWSYDWFVRVSLFWLRFFFMYLVTSDKGNWAAICEEIYLFDASYEKDSLSRSLLSLRKMFNLVCSLFYRRIFSFELSSLEFFWLDFSHKLVWIGILV